ncbi:DUF7563 family protein [Haloarcula laminariae]
MTECSPCVEHVSDQFIPVFGDETDVRVSCLFSERWHRGSHTRA